MSEETPLWGEEKKITPDALFHKLFDMTPELQRKLGALKHLKEFSIPDAEGQWDRLRGRYRELREQNLARGGGDAKLETKMNRVENQIRSVAAKRDAFLADADELGKRIQELTDDMRTTEALIDDIGAKKTLN